MLEGTKLKIIRLAAVTALVTVILDQITKALIMHYLALYDSVEIIPNFFNIVYWLNPGAAFGIFQEGGFLRTLFLALVSVAALIILSVLIWQSDDTKTAFALSLIGGGAIGNLIDRVRFEAVVDFLDFSILGYHWPAFNVADSAITIGVMAAIVIFYFSGLEKTEEE